MQRPWMPMYSDGDQRDRYYRAAQVRQARLTAAREKGRHTKQDWKILRGVFDACVCCGAPYSLLIGGTPTKDHIVPIKFGGCDCLANLQPACRQCNSQGIYEDLRETALPGWQTIYLHRLGTYY